MERLINRFIEYTTYATTAIDDAEVCPSNPSQWDLARLLESQLKALGLKDVEVDEHCFVYGHLPANCDRKCPTVGFLAHMDTSDATSGTNVKARVIENYDGKDITLSDGIVTTVKEYPVLESLKGKTLIVTDGTTLLGGDDKAGIAIIMEVLEELIASNEEHGTIYVSFTPDEEIGTGIHNIDLSKFPVDFAYTVDGGQAKAIAYENFNAARATVDFYGNSIHPGSAKNKMINALQLAMDFHQNLPVNMRPEFTENREGFNHITDLSGNCQQAKASYIIRNHDSELLERQKQQFFSIAEMMNSIYGKTVVKVDIRDQYRNMFEMFRDKMYIIDLITKSYSDLGLSCVSEPVRGGTDGAQLTYMGIPTPNLATGDYFCHGNHELVCVEEMKTMCDVIRHLIINISNFSL